MGACGWTLLRACPCVDRTVALCTGAVSPTPFAAGSYFLAVAAPCTTCVAGARWNYRLALVGGIHVSVLVTPKGAGAGISQVRAALGALAVCDHVGVCVWAGGGLVALQNGAAGVTVSGTSATTVTVIWPAAVWVNAGTETAATGITYTVYFTAGVCMDGACACLMGAQARRGRRERFGARPAASTFSCPPARMARCRSDRPQLRRSPVRAGRFVCGVSSVMMSGALRCWRVGLTPSTTYVINVVATCGVDTGCARNETAAQTIACVGGVGCGQI